MAHSSELGAGDVKLLKDQYNNLRKDVLDTATGHDHTGAAGHGKQLDHGAQAGLTDHDHPMYDHSVRDYICVRDKKTQNTEGGTFTLGDWRKRDITEELVDTGSICSIGSSQITLAAGTYRCLISAPARQVGLHQTRLQNVTDAATLLVGTSEFASPLDTARVANRSIIVGRFTLAAQKVLEIQHQSSATRADSGFGSACNFTDEIYTVAEFWREVA